MRSGLILGLLASGALIAGCASNGDLADNCYYDTMASSSTVRDSATPQIMTYDPYTRAETRTNVNSQTGDISVSGTSRAGSARAQVSSTGGASAQVRADGTAGAVAIKDDNYKIAAANPVSESAVGIRGDLSSGTSKSCKVKGVSESSGRWPWSRSSSPARPSSSSSN